MYTHTDTHACMYIHTFIGTCTYIHTTLFSLPLLLPSSLPYLHQQEPRQCSGGGQCSQFWVHCYPRHKDEQGKEVEPLAEPSAGWTAETHHRQPSVTGKINVTVT